jgi:hypothetical protein
VRLHTQYIHTWKESSGQLYFGPCFELVAEGRMHSTWSNRSSVGVVSRTYLPVQSWTVYPYWGWSSIHKYCRDLYHWLIDPLYGFPLWDEWPQAIYHVLTMPSMSKHSVNGSNMLKLLCLWWWMISLCCTKYYKPCKNELLFRVLFSERDTSSEDLNHVAASQHLCRLLTPSYTL